MSDAAETTAPAIEADSKPPVPQDDPTSVKSPAKTSWADEQEEDESRPPPGFEEVPKGTFKVDAEDKANQEAAAVEAIQGVSVNEADTDEPDIATGKFAELNKEAEAEETEIKKVTADVASPYASAKTFEELNLSPELLQGLYTEMKFEKPSRIQAETLPMILLPDRSGVYRNLIAQAHNGSGKTTCFVLGMLSRVDGGIKAPQAMCICPTRELVVQNVQVLQRMGKFSGVTCASTASTDCDERRRARITDQIVIGTPGRLKAWMSSKPLVLDPKHMKVLVFDEADHMFDSEGFHLDSTRMVRKICDSSRNTQILLFSATFSDKVKKFAVAHVRNANQVFVRKEDLSLDVIKQHRVLCPREQDKQDVLKDRILPACDKLGQTIIFVKTRRSAHNLHEVLLSAGWKCTSISGDMRHEERDRVIDEFRKGVTKILIATDVLSRGFDQSTVTLVVNYDMPVTKDERPAFETYMHRIGRSGRFGLKGAAFNLLFGRSEIDVLQKISTHFDRTIVDVPHDDDDAFERVLQEAGLMSRE